MDHTQDHHNQAHDHLVTSIITAIKEAYPPPTCLTEEEQRWVRLAIEASAQRAELRKAIIEKSLFGLIWTGILGLGYLLLDGLKAHGFK